MVLKTNERILCKPHLHSTSMLQYQIHKNENESETIYDILRNDTLEFGRDLFNSQNIIYARSQGDIEGYKLFNEKYDVFLQKLF